MESITSTRATIAIAAVFLVGNVTFSEAAHGQCEVQAITEPDGLGIRLHMHDDFAVMSPWMTHVDEHYVVVYRRNGLQLEEEAVLFSPDPDDSALFGIAVHAHGEWVAVGDTTLNRVYLYRYVDKQWVHEQTLDAPPDGDGRFGNAIAIDGDQMLIGAPKWGLEEPYNPDIGTAHLYRFDGSSWMYEAELPNPDPYEWEPFTQPDNYGWSVALDMNRAVIGAHTAEMNAGRAFVYEKQNDEWTVAHILKPDPQDQYGGFGQAVDISHGLVLVTAVIAPEHGRVYFFDLDGGNKTWVQGADYPIELPSPNFWNVHCGYTAALNETGTKALVGCIDDAEGGTGAGAAFLLRNDGGEWNLQKKLIGSTVTGGMSYGGTVALTGDFALVGAVNAVNPGHVHLFAGVLEEDCLETGQPDACDIFENEAEDSSGNLIPDPCQADLNHDGVVDVFDLLILIGEWGPCADPDDCPADLNGDGVVDVFDLLILIGNWG